MSTTTIHARSAAPVLDVDLAERVISVVAVPYESEALIEYAGEVWREVFSRTAFDGLNLQRPIRVNLNHDKTKTIGRVIDLWPHRPEGLVVDIRIARTPLGDESLQLAAEDCLSASVGFGVNPRTGQILDRATRTRRIIHAIIDHIALTPEPAYDQARVLAVRSSGTPNLDAFTHDPIIAWAQWRTDPVFQWARRRTRQASR